ncbi:MAG: thiamine-phosphate kinase [Prevotellaceae bacterium]|nr:thiamine-phosphate kinase [Prevotellaceae bacterium]
MTEISELGEFGLIRRLTEGHETVQSSTRLGVGDDCAVLSYPDSDIVVTTDMLMEGIHFDLQYTPMKHLGYKSAMVNFSDIYAMNGRPRQLTVSIAIGRRATVEMMDDFYAGLRLACSRHGVDIVGGDTTSSLTGMAVSLTCIGNVATGEAVRRDGAKETDIICVSGDLGAAYMGLRLMEREKEIFNRQREEGMEAAQPDFAGREYLVERLLKPEARRDIVERLAEAGIRPTSMIDISDGLSSELLHLCTQSHTGCRIYEERIPIDYQTAAAAEEFNLNVTTCAMNGGEDYELLFTVPLSEHDRVAALDDVHVVGHMQREALGCVLVGRGDGAEEFEIKAQGWNHAEKSGTEA